MDPFLEWLFENKPICRYGAWMDLVSMQDANHQIVISEPEMCRRWGWSRGKVRRFLHDMTVQGGGQKTVQGGLFGTTIITIGCRDDQKTTNKKRYREAVQGDDPKKNGFFQRFWEAYPKNKRKDKARAEMAWNNIIPKPDECFLKMVLSALEWQKKSEDWTKEDGKYVIWPERYITRRRWEDEPIITDSNNDFIMDLFK